MVLLCFFFNKFIWLQQTDQPLLDDYTLTYGAGLPTEGTWNLKRVINGTETDLTNPAVTAFGNLSPQCDDSPNPPEVVEIIPPSTNVDLSGDYTYVINYPEAENLTSPTTAKSVLKASNFPRQKSKPQPKMKPPPH